MHNTIGAGHFDLKLENFLLGNDYRPKLADYGFACFLFTNQTVPLGTPIYSAPEVFSGSFSGPGPDLYSLGIILFTLYFG